MAESKQHNACLVVSFMFIVTCMIRFTRASADFQLGYKLPKSETLATFSMISPEDCIKECQARIVCRSVQYEPRYPVCRLSESDIESIGASLVNSPGTWYSEKNDWAKKSIDPRCETDCDIRETCEISGDQVTCEIRECTLPTRLDINSVIFGNMVSVGSNIVHECPMNQITGTKKRVKSTCEPNGAWSLQEFSCPVAPACNPGWIQHGVSCYYFDPTLRYAETAQTYCSTMFSRLVRVETPEENEFLKNYLNTNFPNKSFWLGITDEAAETTWTWYDDPSTVITFFDWANIDEGAYNIGENCAVFHKVLSLFWGDVKCDSLRDGTVCEIDYSQQLQTP